MSRNNKYILSVRPDIIREIGKRGIKILKKDESGIVRRIPNKISSSSFGWGTVDDTIPVHKKELKDIKRNLNSIIGQIGSGAVLHPLEREPPVVSNGKRQPVIDVDELAAPAHEPKRIRIPTILEEWHLHCKENYDKGTIGFIPECYHSNGMPPLEEMAHTTVGQVLLNFASFIKLLW
jgi:hypothetical protein